jgi:hypothetical protein
MSSTEREMANPGRRDAIAFDQPMRDLGNRLVRRAENGAAPTREERGHAPDVVAVVMRGENGRELQALFLEEALDGRAFARIDGRGAPALGDHPDVVVPERRNGVDLHHAIESIRIDSWRPIPCRAGSRPRSGATFSTRSGSISTT